MPDARVQAAAALVRKGSVFSLTAEPDPRDPPRTTIDHWARRGIAGRGVLLDLERALRDGGRPYAPDGAAAFTVADLEHARAHAGIDYSPGDIVLLRTGFLGWHRRRARRPRLRLAAGLRAPGLEPTGELARYLRDRQVRAVASDSLALGELWWLDDLAADCDQDGVYEFFLTSEPPNTLAIK
jgi:kynurenine formamidase